MNEALAGVCCRGRPVVDVIVPVFNGESTLDAALRSVARQTFGAWRVTVVDDGSTDGSAAVARRWALRDSRFRVISKANGGLSSARNAGIAATDGVFLFFLDADDVIDADALDDLVSAAQEMGASHCGYRFLDAVLGSIGRETSATLPYVGIDELLEWCRFVVHAQLISRDALAGEGFDERLRTSEDYDLWLRLAERGVRWKGVDREHAGYRIRAGSMSKDFVAMGRDAAGVVRASFKRCRRNADVAGRIDVAFEREGRVLDSSMLGYAARRALCGDEDAIDQAATMVRNCTACFDLDTFARACVFGLQHGFGVAPSTVCDGFVGMWPLIVAWFKRCEHSGVVAGTLDAFSDRFARVAMNPREVASRMLDAAGVVAGASVGVIVGANGIRERFVLREAEARGSCVYVGDAVDGVRGPLGECVWEEVAEWMISAESRRLRSLTRRLDARVHPRGVLASRAT